MYDSYDHYTTFYKDLQDDYKGKRYREWVGIHDHIPSESDMNHFRSRIGEEVFQIIMAILVLLFQMVGILTGATICTDGTLLEAFANFRGCNYMGNCCYCMACPSSMLDHLEQEVNQTIDEIEQEDTLSKVLNITIQCPRPSVIEKMKKAIEQKKKKVVDADIGLCKILRIKITRNPIDGWQEQLSYLEHLCNTELKIPDGYGIDILSSALTRNSETNQLTYCCPKASKDVEARTGYRRNTQTGKIEAVFGYKAVIMTVVEKILGIEVPVMAGTGPGNISEAKTYIEVSKRLKQYVPFQTKYEIWIQDMTMKRYIRMYEVKELSQSLITILVEKIGAGKLY